MRTHRESLGRQVEKDNEHVRRHRKSIADGPVDGCNKRFDNDDFDLSERLRNEQFDRSHMKQDIGDDDEDRSETASLQEDEDSIEAGDEDEFKHEYAISQ